MMNRTTRTTAHRKAKKSYTLSPESVAFLEALREKRNATSTSSVLEEIIQTIRLGQKKRAIEQAVTDYYSSLPKEERDDQAAWAEFALTQFPEDEIEHQQ
jgi:DNA-binding PadR family transcriptional regulator